MSSLDPTSLRTLLWPRSTREIRIQHVLWMGVALFALSQILFLINIQFPRGHNFDEFHYVPSAKQWLEMQENQNWEHPPLGKLIMAIGIALWGDIPIGWRFMSTIFASLTLVGMYAWALALFASEATALWVAALTIVNQLLYVQARIGMLDTFMFAFIAWAMAAFTAAWRPGLDPRRARKLLLGAGIAFGFGTACKWFTLMPWLGCLALVGVVRLLQSWKTRFEDASSDDWYHPGLWAGLRLGDWALCLGVAPLLAYFSTFIPYFILQKPPVGFWDLFLMQKKMYEGQLRVVTQHPYMSNWPDWPLLTRPIWYAFDKEDGPAGESYVRGVILLGNPLIMWSGILAVVACAVSWLETKRRDAFLILAAFAVLYGSWAAIPRKVSFYYYYYPAGMVLSLALAYVLHHARPIRVSDTGLARAAMRAAPYVFLAAAAGVFVYFFPILAGLRIPSDTFRKWMWFRTWI